LDDAAFLAMDLQYRGRADLATLFLDAYRQLAHDRAPASLAHFYAAYRAVVRAKVDCIRADQGSASAVADARRHLRLALDQLRAGTVQVVLIGGGPASGKTTLAPRARFENWCSGHIHRRRQTRARAVGSALG
jgi:predicted ribonuclease YlaK